MSASEWLSTLCLFAFVAWVELAPCVALTGVAGQDFPLPRVLPDWRPDLDFILDACLV